MSTILLSIGSNTFAKTNIDKAKRMLAYIFNDIHFSDPILSEPEDDKYKYLFRNILVSCQTDLSPQEVIDKIKQTERAVGRTPRDKYLGKVIIDIDLLKYNDKILRPEDYEREYIQQLLAIFEIPEPKVEEPIVEEPTSTEKEESIIAEPKASESNIAETSKTTENLETAETEETKPADSSAEETKQADSKTEKTEESETSKTSETEETETSETSKTSETEELKSANSNTEDEETSEKE